MLAQLVTCGREQVSFEPLATIGENIARLRMEAGHKKQGDFAGVLGVPQGQLSDWENNRYGLLDTDTLIKIAKVLGCSIDRLIAGVDPTYDAVVARDLVRPDRVVESALTQDVGGPLDETAAARILRLERENIALRTALDQTEDVVSQLGQIAGDLTEARDAALATAGRRANDRKTG